MAPVEEPKVSAFAQERLSAFSVENVLFATDFSPVSEAALPYAAAICRHFGSKLHVVHVLSDAGLLVAAGGVDYVTLGSLLDQAHAEVRQKLEGIVEPLEGIARFTHVGHGPVWSFLEGVIRENRIDLIVVGTHGRTGLGRLLLGSVAESILRRAPCPVLTIGPHVSGHDKLPAVTAGESVPTHRDLAPPELELQQIVFATNFEENADLLAQAAISLAEQFRSRLTLLHVIEDYAQLGSRPAPIDVAAGRLRNLLAGDVTLQYAPETMVEFGPPAERILKVAADREADLIVLGARAAAEVGSTHMPWSTAHHVIANSACPVLTIRG